MVIEKIWAVLINGLRNAGFHFVNWDGKRRTRPDCAERRVSVQAAGEWFCADAEDDVYETTGCWSLVLLFDFRNLENE
jgi:hypothetical protein